MPARCKRTLIPVAAVALCAAAVPVFAHPAHLAADRQAAPQAIQAAPVRDISLEQAIAAARRPARPATYRVQTGDTLSAIAGRFYSSPSAWPVLYWANRIRWADVIEAGQVLQVPAEPASIPAAPGQLEPPAPRPVRVLAAYAPAPVSVPAQAPVSAQVAAVSYGGGVPASFQACVIARESGGNARAVNPSSGAGGLYQFLPSSWSALGYSGLPEDASVAVQTQAFDKLYAEDGGSPWLADGCPGT
jgi:resuscitation-promoting factor RpfC